MLGLTTLVLAWRAPFIHLPHKLYTTLEMKPPQPDKIRPGYNICG